MVFTRQKAKAGANPVIQIAPQRFSTESLPTRLDRLVRPTVISANRHQKKCEVNNPKVGSLLMTG